jgi:hypothetical protein
MILEFIVGCVVGLILCKLIPAVINFFKTYGWDPLAMIEVMITYCIIEITICLLLIVGVVLIII